MSSKFPIGVATIERPLIILSIIYIFIFIISCTPVNLSKQDTKSTQETNISDKSVDTIDEKKVIESYRKSFDAGIDPKLFLNDFLEVLYYIKNINSISLGGTNFNLNDNEFKKISEIANKTNVQEIILFWQFTIKTIDELEIVSNPNLSVEMFLV